MNKGFSFFKKHEDGQVLVLVALMLVGLIGFAALLTDGGMMQLSRRELQAAADAAALAGASYLPGDPTTAKNTARNYVLQNGFLETDITITPNTPYEGDDEKIEVVLELPATFTFGRIFKPSDSTILARAVAVAYNAWDGEALPFINQEDYNTSNGDVWNKVRPGNFESMYEASEHGFTMEGDCNFSVDYENGLQVKNGVVANKKQEVECVLLKNKGSGYLFSLSKQAIDAGKVSLPPEKNNDELVWRYLDTKIGNLKKLGNKDLILPCSDGYTNEKGECDTGYPQLVLLEIFDAEYKFKDIGFEVKGVYNIFGVGDEKTVPGNGSGMSGSGSDLVE